MRVTSTHLEIKLVTFNLLHHQALSHPQSDIQWVIDNWGPDIIGCQEAEEYHSVLKGFPKYGFAWGGGSGNAGEVPILYKKDTLRLVAAFTHQVTWFSAKHVDPHRYVNAAHFVTRVDGRHIWYFNTHANHHIEVGGHPRHSPSAISQEKGFKLMARLVQEQAVKPGNAVFWGGDLNVSEKADNTVSWQGFPNYIFHHHGMISIYDELKSVPGGRVIDVIGSCNQDTDVKGLHYYTGPKLNSDHRPRSAVYRMDRIHSSGGADQPAPTPTPTPTPDQPTNNPYYPLPDQDLPDNIPVPQPLVPLPPVLEQPVGTWDHSVCCKKNG